ncbi:MAG: hypothetical protein JSS68_08565 [Actinobacteria bacterium]|nr:hypothetical protein [Actinomycetota bacterium]
MELQGPRAKLDWAIQKLETLDTESKAFLETQPLRAVSEFDDEAGCHIIRLRSNAGPYARGLHMGLMVGDVVHNARSALDHAAWLLACRSNPVNQLWEPRTARKISFPVTTEPELFKTHRVIPFLHEDAIAVLEEFQPYQGGDTADCIGHLDTLWNIDKHRVIHTSTINVDTSSISFRNAAIDMADLIEHPPETSWTEVPERIEDGTEIARVRFHSGNGPPWTKVKVEGQPSCEVAFGSGEFMFPPDALGGLLVATARALSAIEGLPEIAPS